MDESVRIENNEMDSDTLRTIVLPKRKLVLVSEQFMDSDFNIMVDRIQTPDCPLSLSEVWVSNPYGSDLSYQREVNQWLSTRASLYGEMKREGLDEDDELIAQVLFLIVGRPPLPKDFFPPAHQQIAETV
jgi:hypothetical protein